MDFKKQNKDFIGLSSWKGVALIGATAALFLAACSDDSSSNSSNNNDIPDIEEMSKADVASLLQINTVKSKDKLKKCDSTNAYDRAYVKSTDEFYFCFKNEWQPNNDLGILESRDVVNECSGENEDKLFKKKRYTPNGDYFYETFYCENGKWTSEIGGSDGQKQECKDCNIGDFVKTGTFTDKRDGKKYKTVTIEEMTWMAENLNYEYKVNGKTYGSYCLDDDEKNCDKYGRLYTYAAAVDSAAVFSDVDGCSYKEMLEKKKNCYDKRQQNKRGICPEGWRLASGIDWWRLVQYSGSSAKILKSKKTWEIETHGDVTNDGNGTDDYGMAILGAGERTASQNDAKYQSEHRSAIFWTSDFEGSHYSDIFLFSLSNSLPVLFYDDVAAGHSVRCVKD